jgi:hypothetical protein
VSRRGSPFVRGINRTIVALGILVVVVASLHYVSVVHENHRMRQELCAAKLEALTARNAFLKSALGGPADTCEELTTLTGEPPPRPASRRRAGV